MALVSKGEHELGMAAFDLVFSDGLSDENNFLLLIKVWTVTLGDACTNLWFHSGSPLV